MAAPGSMREPVGKSRRLSPLLTSTVHLARSHGAPRASPPASRALPPTSPAGRCSGPSLTQLWGTSAPRPTTPAASIPTASRGRGGPLLREGESPPLRCPAPARGTGLPGIAQGRGWRSRSRRPSARGEPGRAGVAVSLSASSPPPSGSSHSPPSPMRPNLADVSTPGADSRCSGSSKVPVSHGVPGGWTCPRDVGSWRPRPRFQLSSPPCLAAPAPRVRTGD